MTTTSEQKWREEFKNYYKVHPIFLRDKEFPQRYLHKEVNQAWMVYQAACKKRQEEIDLLKSQSYILAFHEEMKVKLKGRDELISDFLDNNYCNDSCYRQHRLEKQCEHEKLARRAQRILGEGGE